MKRSIVIEEFTPDWAISLGLIISKKENGTFRYKIIDFLYVKELVICFSIF